MNATRLEDSGANADTPVPGILNELPVWDQPDRSGSVELSEKEGVIDTPVAPDEGVDRLGAAGLELTKKVDGLLKAPKMLVPPGSIACACQQ